MEETVITLETTNHVVEIAGDCLTIGTKTFPDDCVSLNAEETQLLIKLVLGLRTPRG